MTAKEFNADYWVIFQSPMFPRKPISFDLLSSLLGCKLPKVLLKLEQNKNDKLIVRPFHGEVYIFYRH